MPKQIAIIGTTASGKSALAIGLAREFNAAILSLDSLAIYKQIDIASAKPTPNELACAPHFGIDEIYPNEPFSVGEFFKIYKKAREFCIRENKPLIITGGSGFYLKAMMSGLTPDVPKCKTPSNAEIYALAERIDPKFATKFSQNDSYRLEKWYQIYKFSGEIPSLWLEKNTSAPLILNLAIFEILWDSQILRERIAVRTKQMLKNGLLDEAKFLFKTYGQKEPNLSTSDKAHAQAEKWKFYAGECKPLGSIGLKECGQFLRGEILSLQELETLITTHTAQLAKRQRTFNRSQFERLAVGQIDEICSRAAEFLRS